MGVYVNHVFENHIKPGQFLLLTTMMVNDFKYLNASRMILAHQKKLTHTKT